jgi:hypothetical protein
MLEQHHSILSTLGIDVWIPKQADTRHFKTSIYRDQVCEELQQPEEALLDLSFDVKINDAHTQPLDRIPDTNTLIRQAEKPLIPQSENQQTSHENIVEIENSKPILITSFEIQAILTSNCLILIDATELNKEQEALWLNIQRSMTSQNFDLKWPFNFNQFQDGRGAQTYLQGFIDGLAQDKKILSLGEIPHLVSDQLTVLASLEEMIAEPLLKRQLWNLMKI